jgi:hypothetical protein
MILIKIHTTSKQTLILTKKTNKQVGHQAMISLVLFLTHNTPCFLYLCLKQLQEDIFFPNLQMPV